MTDRLFPDAQHYRERSDGGGRKQEYGEAPWDHRGVNMSAEEGGERSEKTEETEEQRVVSRRV